MLANRQKKAYKWHWQKEPAGVDYDAVMTDFKREGLTLSVSKVIHHTSENIHRNMCE